MLPPDDDNAAFAIEAKDRYKETVGRPSKQSVINLPPIVLKAKARDQAEEAAKNKGGRPKKDDADKPQQKIVAVIPKGNSNVTDSKTADMFNTNRTYVVNAVKQAKSR